MPRIIRTFTLESELSATLNALAEAGLVSSLLPYLLKSESPPSAPISLPAALELDEAGLRAEDYAQFYSMMKLPAAWASLKAPSMAQLLTAINMYGSSNAKEICSAVNAAAVQNRKLRSQEVHRHKKLIEAAEQASRRAVLKNARNSRNISRIVEALIVLGLETLEGKAALDPARSSKSYASKGGDKQSNRRGRKNFEVRTVRGGPRTAGLSS